jgi:hypothetical protein
MCGVEDFAVFHTGSRARRSRRRVWLGFGTPGHGLRSFALNLPDFLFLLAVLLVEFLLGQGLSVFDDLPSIG